MSTQDKSYVPELHQLRGLAALLVFFYHAMHSGRSATGAQGWPIANDPISAILWEGHSAVALFLVLSGLLLAQKAFVQQRPYGRFIESRVRRIFPLMTLVLVFGLFTVKDIDLGSIAAAFLFLRNTSASFNDPSGITGTLWTVAVEFQFYLVAPFLFVLAKKGGMKKFLLPAIFFLWALRMIVLLPLYDNPAELYRISYFTIVGRANQFMIGIALAYGMHLYRPKPGKIWFLGLVLSVLAISIFLWIVNLGGGIGVYRGWHIILPEVEALLWAAFLISFWMSNPIRWGLVRQVLEFMGTISFGVYVLHYAVQRQFWYLVYPHFFGAPPLNFLGITAVNLALLAFVSGLACISFYCLEAPFTKAGHKFAAEPSAKIPASSNQ